MVMPQAHPSEACEILSQSLSNIDWLKKAYLNCFYRRLSDCRNYIFEYYFNLIIFQFTPASWLQQAASFFQRWKLWLFHFYDFDKNPNMSWIFRGDRTLNIFVRPNKSILHLCENQNSKKRIFELSNIRVFDIISNI